MQTLRDLHSQNAKIMDTMMEELRLVAELAKGPQSSSRYRILIRSAFSNLEALIWIIKQTALAYADSPSDAQFQFANEMTFALSENGSPRETRAKTPFVANLQFAFAFASEVFGQTFRLDKHCPEWSWLVEAIKTRDAITHPKTFAALEITEEQAKRQVDGIIWLMQQMSTIIAVIRQHNERVTRPITDEAHAIIELTKDKIGVSGHACVEQILRMAEAAADKISCASEGANWDQDALIAQLHGEALKFVNERPDLVAAIPDDTFDMLDARITNLFEQNPITSRIIGVEPKTLFAKISDIKRGLTAEEVGAGTNVAATVTIDGASTGDAGELQCNGAG